MGPCHSKRGRGPRHAALGRRRRHRRVRQRSAPQRRRDCHDRPLGRCRRRRRRPRRRCRPCRRSSPAGRWARPISCCRWPTPFDIAAEPRSVYGDFPLATRFDEDRFIDAAEVQPGAPERHASRQRPTSTMTAAPTGSPASRLAPEPSATRPGVAKLLPKGTVLNLDMHYNPRHQPARDPGTRVALKFTDRPVPAGRHHRRVRHQRHRHPARRAEPRDRRAGRSSSRKTATS